MPRTKNPHPRQIVNGLSLIQFSTFQGDDDVFWVSINDRKTQKPLEVDSEIFGKTGNLTLQNGVFIANKDQMAKNSSIAPKYKTSLKVDKSSPIAKRLRYVDTMIRKFLNYHTKDTMGILNEVIYKNSVRPAPYKSSDRVWNVKLSQKTFCKFLENHGDVPGSKVHVVCTLKGLVVDSKKGCAYPSWECISLVSVDDDKFDHTMDSDEGDLEDGEVIEPSPRPKKKAKKELKIPSNQQELEVMQDFSSQKV